MDLLTDRETIELRGHHLINLRHYIEWREDTKDPSVHLDPELRERELSDGYSEESINKRAGIYSRIFDKGLQVAITDELDDICKSCNIEADVCKDEFGFDKRVASYLGFNIGQEYSAKEVVEKLKRFKSSSLLWMVCVDF